MQTDKYKWYKDSEVIYIIIASIILISLWTYGLCQ